MLHCVHQQVTNCVCLLFGAELLMYTGFLELFRWKQLPAAAENDALGVVRVNQNSEIAGQTAKQCWNSL